MTSRPRSHLPRLRRRHRSRGQSLVEFALILPIMLTLLGASVDFARVYKGWIDLQAATRAAAEYVAMNDPSQSAAQTHAQAMVCAQVTGNASCTSPTVTVTSFTVSATAPGGTSEHPVGSATVASSMPFRMLFSYPLLTQGGSWTIGATESFSVVQGR